MGEKSIRFKQEEDRVLFIFNGVLLAEWPYDKALEISRALRGIAMIAEEYANVDQIVEDWAIMQRTGMNIGLSNNPAIAAEAHKEAQWNKNLRRYVPNSGAGVPKSAIVGAPQIINCGGQGIHSTKFGKF